MTESETLRRRDIAFKIGPIIGQVDPNIIEVIHHSSTRRPDGALPESDIDMTIVTSNLSHVHTQTGRYELDHAIATAIEPEGISLGNGPMQLHLSHIDPRMIARPHEYLLTDDRLDALIEILARGEVVYHKE